MEDFKERFDVSIYNVWYWLVPGITYGLTYHTITATMASGLTWRDTQ